MFHTLALASLVLLPSHVIEPPSDDGAIAVPNLELSIDLSHFSDVKGGLDEQEQRKGDWSAKLGDLKVNIELIALEKSEGFEFEGPSEVASLVANNRGNEARKKGGGYAFEVSEPLVGKFGWVPYGWLASHDVYEGTRKAGYEIMVAGVTQTAGYFLDISIPDLLTDEEFAALRAWAATAIDYSGEVMDPEWTEEEGTDRWEAQAPDSVKGRSKKSQILRSDYYIIFTNIGKSTARAFMDKVDENYETVRDVFPFEDIEGQRLLPIFYFQDREQYLDWCVKNIGWDREQAARSGGVATGDVYSTYHQSVNAPVHIHEQTHQIFRNRLHLSGGGSWFQEGVAEYMSANQGDLSQIKSLAKKKRTQPFEEFMVVKSLLMSSPTGSKKEGGSAAGGAYDQAAAIIEFCKHSKFAGEKFLDWVHAMGRVGRGDLPAIRRGITQVYGVSLEEFEEEFIAYWVKRKKVRGWHEPAPKPKKSKKKRR